MTLAARLSIALVFAAAACAGACGGIGVGSGGPSGFLDGTETTSDASAASGSASVSEDAGAFADHITTTVTSANDAGAAGASNPSNALCGNLALCDPDEKEANGCAGAGDVDAGSVASGGGDAGAARDASSGEPTTACRVVGADSTSSAAGAVCVEEGPGSDGAACTDGSDCSAGFECVGSPGVCRQYCCAGSCADTKTFCDVQFESDSHPSRVPVCMPVEPCKLLIDSSCATGSTCSVVADDGTTSCVATGSAGEGAACDVDHCEQDEICLGESGSRICEKLCTVGGTDCATGQTCTGNTELFQGSSVGLCQPVSP